MTSDIPGTIVTDHEMLVKQRTGVEPIEIAETIARDGCALLPGAIGPDVVEQLRSALEHARGAEARQRAGTVYAIRHLLQAVPAVAELAGSAPIRALVETVLGPDAFPVRGLLFDKPDGANWKVPWHQDLTIAVRERIDLPGFGVWSVKAGIPHVQPPISVLERMLAVRVHLDDCGLENGPLQVLPGSHAHGRFDAPAIQRWRQSVPAVPCLVGLGGILLMRPLLLHASAPATRPAHRRVIHLEFAADALPGGLRWQG